MILLAAIPFSIIGGWWLSNIFWWNLWRPLRAEKDDPVRPLRQSLRWFVWTAFIPFAASSFLLMFALEEYAPQGDWFWIQAVYWIGGGNLLILLGDRIPGVGSRYKLALKASRSRWYGVLGWFSTKKPEQP